jgi:uncharacterized protein YabN with tetrapyrrole methylase and pyrophosphatase domain
LLDGVPSALPALAQAYAYLDRAGRLGFDLVMVAEGPSDDLLGGLLQEDVGSVDSESFGQLLLALVNVARDADLDPESALREASLRFAERFRVLEREARRQDVSIDDMPTEMVRRLWGED